MKKKRLINLNNIGISWGMLYNMMQVKINAFDVGVFGSDEVQSDSQATTNINKLPELLKAFVRLNNMLNNNISVVEHHRFKNLIELGVQREILKDGKNLGAPRAMLPPLT